MLDDGETIINKEAVNLLLELIKYFRLSYRSIERTLSYFALIQNMAGGTQYSLPYQRIIPFICYLKSSKPDLVDRIAKNKIDSQALIKEVGLKDIDKNTDYRYIYHLRQRLIYDLANDEQKQKMLDDEEKLIDDPSGRISGNIIVKVCSWLTNFNRQP
jgi:hypothetical protein